MFFCTRMRYFLSLYCLVSFQVVNANLRWWGVSSSSPLLLLLLLLSAVLSPLLRVHACGPGHGSMPCITKRRNFWSASAFVSPQALNVGSSGGTLGFAITRPLAPVRVDFDQLVLGDVKAAAGGKPLLCFLAEALLAFVSSGLAVLVLLVLLGTSSVDECDGDFSPIVLGRVVAC